MIQQTNSVNNNNVIKQRLIQMCEQDSVQVGAVASLVKNLFQIQQIQNSNSNLVLLIQAVIQLANLPYLTPKASNILIDVLISMLKQASQLRYKVGVYYLSQLLAQPKIIYILSEVLFQSNSEANTEIIQRKKQIHNCLASQNIQILCQKLSQNNIKSQMILTSLGVIKFLLAIICLPSMDEAQNKKDNQKILKLIVKSCQILLKERHKNINKDQILIFLHICIHLQNLFSDLYAKRLVGFQLGWDLITLVFSAQILEKKLSALSALDILIQELNKKLAPGQTQIKNELSKKVLKFLKLILQPRNHQQILNRSINFLLYWIQNVQSQSELQGLTEWLVYMIYKSDIRTSNIFGNCWQKLIQKIEIIQSLQINAIYKISISILDQMKQIKNQSTISTRSRSNKEKQKNQLEVKIMKIISPLIKKQFLQVSMHGEATCKYLTYIWQSLQQFSPSLSAKITEQVKKSIVAGTSVAFNCYILSSNINMLNQLVNKYNLKQNQGNLKVIQNQISLIYNCIHCYLSWILKLAKKTTYINQQSPEQSKQIIQQSIQLLTSQQLIGNLIISHNPSNSQQLKNLLELSNLIIECVNEREFQYKFLHLVMNKIDNADEIFIIWLKNRLYFIQNMNFKKNITGKLFENPKVYSNISISALKQLLEILSMSDFNRQKKQLSCFSILKQIDDENRQSAINLVLISMWSVQEIAKQYFLTEISDKILKMNFTDCQQMQVYLQINKICSKWNPIKSDRLFSQNVAMQEDVQIKIILLQNLSKVIKCSDSISFAKITKNQIQPLLNSELFVKFSIQSIIFNKIQIHGDNSLLTLRKLGFKSNQINQIHVILRQKSYLLIKNIKDGMLNHILSNFYTSYLNTLDLIDIFTKNQWKSLHKYLENQIIEEKNIKLQSIIKQNLLILLKKAIKKLLSSKQHTSQKIIQELADFLTQIDVKELLKNQISQQNGYSHCIFMSKNQYFSSKALQLFKDGQYENMQMDKKKSGKKKNQKLKKIQRLHQHKIGYQFMNTIIVGENLEQKICGELDYYIQQRLISQNYYMIAYGLECLWITLKNSEIMVMFIQSNKFNDIFKMLSRYCQQLLSPDLEYVEEGELQMYCKIMITALKIVNKIWIVILLKFKSYQGILITRNSKDLLNLQQTKKNIQEINTIQTLDQLVTQNKGIPQIVNIEGRCQFPNLNIQLQEIIFITIGASSLMQKFRTPSQINNVFLLFYEASRLNCWLIIQNIQEKEQKKIIQFSIKNLNNNCLELSSVCKSILYIYLILHPQSQILFYLFQQFKENINNSKAFYQIFGQSFALSKNQQITHTIVQTFFNNIMDMKPEQNQTSNQPLSEILKIINKNMTQFNQSVCEKFLSIMMKSYLFDDQGEIKAVHPKTRKIIYQSVQQCLRVHQQLEVQPIFKQVIQQINIGNSCQSLIKQNDKGVGLQNLGNICYMNSQLQLLHSVKPFVNLINEINTEFPLLLGLQKLFLNLTHSLNKSISPQEFILSFDPPVNVSLQEDTTQFLIQFLDKLQAGEKNVNLPQKFKHLFKGQTESSMECSKCKKSKAKYQDFLLHSLNIKNQNNHFSTLEQCIQNAKNPQIIYDVNCDRCNQKTTFNKTTKLKKIPNYLFINLKRLIFDYSNPYTKIKIHSRLEFPDELKINQQILVLKAVITHSGTGEYGHYFTSVKEDQKWIVYNDSKVYLMPENGREDIWYGSLETKGEISYSTNAYVLLYQKTPQIKKNNQSIPNISNKQIIEEIRKTNKVLFTKQILFGQRYLRDFVNFAYNIVKLPKNPNKYSCIYQLLGSVSFCHNKIIEIPPNNYFQNLENNSNPEDLINLIYQYKQHNNQLLFHRNYEIRSFFSTFLMQVFRICQGKSQLTLVYACQILNKYISLIKENHNFVNSGQYTKLIAFLLRDYFKSAQFMKEYFQSKIVAQIISLYKTRKIQISLQYRTGVQIMQPFIELLLSFVCFVKNQQSGMVLQFINYYQQDFFQIRQVVKNDTDIIQLIFLNNSNSQYIKTLFEFLQLNREQSYLKTLVELTTSLICNWNVVDIKFCKNFSFLVLYLYQQYYSYEIDRKMDFNRSILGVMFPFKTKNTDQRVVCLKDRTYEYLTSKLQPSLIQIISRILISITNEQKNQIDTLEAVDILLKLLIEILKKDNLFVRIFNNLCSPIGLYGDFYLFIQNQTNQFLNKISSRAIIISDNNSEFEEKKKKLEESIQLLRNILKIDNIESQTILCGLQSKKPQQIIETLSSNNIFVRVEECSYYWIGFKDNGKSQLHQHVSKQYTLNEGEKNIELTKIMKPFEQEQIQQEGPYPMRIKIKKANHQQIDMEHNLQINSNAVRRKFIFSNTGEQQCIVQIRILCSNMKNENIQVIFKLNSGQNTDIWVQKKRMFAQWGQMILFVNGTELKISFHQSMDAMDQGINNFDAIMVQNVSLNQNDAMM